MKVLILYTPHPYKIAGIAAKALLDGIKQILVGVLLFIGIAETTRMNDYLYKY